MIPFLLEKNLMPLQLTVISLDFDSDEKPRTEIFDKEIINIGRGDSNDIILKGSDVSEKHAQLRIKENGVGTLMFISDLGSTNGTKVENDFIKAQQEVAFEFNKRISIGSYLIKPSKLEASGLKDFSRTESGRFTPPKSTLSKVRIPGSGGDLLKGGKTEISSQLQNDLNKLKKATKAPAEKVEEKVAKQAVEKKAEEVKTQEPKVAPPVEEKPQASKSALSALKSLAALSSDNAEKEKSTASDKPERSKSGLLSAFSSKEKKAVTETTKSEEIKAAKPEAKKPESKKAETKKPEIKAAEIKTESSAPKKKEEVSKSKVEAKKNEPAPKKEALKPEVSVEKKEIKAPKVEPKIKKQSSASDQALKATSTEETPVTVTLEGSDVSDLDFEAIELFDVSGQVRHKGKGLEGVSIEAGEIGSTTTDSSGSFSFSEIVEGTEYEIVAKKDGFRIPTDDNKGTIESDIKITVLATKLLSLKGKIIHTGKAVDGVTLNAGSLGTTTSDSDGYFEFKDIAEDTEYEVSASKAKFSFGTPTLSGTLTEDSKGLVFEGLALLSISGRVMHKGKPMEGVEIDGGPLGKTTTDAKGYYCFADVPDGTQYSLTARKGKFTFGTRKGTSGQ